MSLFGVKRPPDITWTVSGTGASILSPTTIAANLSDGRPDSVAQFTWISGAQTTASVTRIRADWSATAISPRLVMLSNISLPAGMLVSVNFRRVGDTAGTYPYTPSNVAGPLTLGNNPQRVFALPEGGKNLVIVIPPGATTCLGCEIVLTNDVNGAATIAASTVFSIGEIGIAGAYELDVDAGWDIDHQDPTTQNYNWNSNPFTQPGTPFRVATLPLPAFGLQTAFFGDASAPTAIDWEQVLAGVNRGQSVILVPRYLGQSGSIDTQMLHRTAMFCTATKLPKFLFKSGPYFAGDALVLSECPIPV